MTASTFTAISLGFCALCWGIGGLAFAYCQYRDAQWSGKMAQEENEPDDPSEQWKRG